MTSPQLSVKFFDHELESWQLAPPKLEEGEPRLVNFTYLGTQQALLTAKQI